MLTSSQLSELMTMHTYCRPAGSWSEEVFRDTYLIPLGVEMDAYGNLHKIIGDDPRIVFSSHTDTVHWEPGMQRVGLTTDGVLCTYWPDADCLGADDTAGVFLMRQMILAGIPGHYIFHFAEEVGCQGSGELARWSSQVLDGREIAIAFDRGNHHDVITHQQRMRTCSDAFAQSLADALGMGYTPSDRGVYTDTREYMDLIPECTNISVGYLHAHTGNETLDTVHIGALLARLLVIDWDSLVVERDPTIDDRPPQTVITRWYGSDVSQPVLDATVVDVETRDYSAECYLTSWECLVCSRMNRDTLDVCLTCGQDRDDNDRAFLDQLIARHKAVSCACAYASMGGHEPECEHWQAQIDITDPR